MRGPQDRDSAEQELSGESGSAAELREPSGEGSPDGGEGGKVTRGDDDVSVFGLTNTILSRWRLVLGWPIGMAVAMAMVSLLIPPTYTANTTFVSEGGSGSRLPAGVSGLAGQLGISLGGDATDLPEFYASVLTSRGILDQVLQELVADPRSGSDADSVLFLALLGVDGDEFADSLYSGRRELQDRISVNVDATTGIVRLSVRARYPELAAVVANSLVEYLNQFNARTRQSQASERRRFIEERMATAQDELHEVEEDLRIFYERNRSWEDSPQLRVEEDRLRRRVQMRQEVSMTLTREYETARIEEVNDTPVITVIDRAVPPQERSSPRRKLMVGLAGLVGGLIGIAGAFAGEYRDRIRQSGDPDYVRFRALIQEHGARLRLISRKILARDR